MTGKKNPKITILIPDFIFGGLEKVMITIANGLKRRGCDINVLTMNASGPLRGSLDEGIPVTDCGVANVRYRNSVIPLIKFFKNDDSGIFVSSLFNEPALFAHMLARSGSKFLTTIHGSARNEIRIDKRKAVRRAALFLSRALLMRSDAIVAVSEGVRDEILLDRSISPEKVSVIYNPVVTSDFYGMADEPAVHPWLSGGDSPLIMSAGRMSAAKGFDVLIKAFAIIAEETSARLMILGDGEEMENLKSLARRFGVEDRTAFPGFQKNPLAFMSKAEIFVLASRSEGLPTVLVEAMFCGAAIVSTDCRSGPSEILDGGRYGELVRVDDAEGLAKAMKRALSRPADKGLLRRRALDFSEDSAIEKYARLLEKISG